MSCRRLASVLALALLFASASTSVAGSGAVSATPATQGQIVSIYPNPVLEDDAGEFVVLSFPRGTDLAGWTLTDGETTLPLGNGTAGGQIAVSADPKAASNLTTHPVRALDGSLSLANGGDELALRYRNETIDETSYENAPDAELYSRVGDGGAWEWERLGATDFEPTRAGPAPVHAFVLPDAPSIPIETIRGAEERILLAGYSFESQRVARELRRAATRGVTVRVLLDDAPAGGISTTQARVLDSLAGTTVNIEVLGGPYGRYDFHHPKYAVVDDRALVMTENWKPAGTGGRASRGWGIVVENPKTADALAGIFRADADWRDTSPWHAFRRGRTFTDEELANETFPTEFEPRSMTAREVTLLAAPDNAERAVVRELDGAEESIAVVQASIGDRDLPFVQALLRAAERGVEVRVLLSSAWYSEADNEAMAARLNRRADAEALPLDARVADPGDRFEKIHAKGVIVDRQTVVVGSLNWNDNSINENREIALVLDGEPVGAYYGRVFDADWKGGDANTVSGEDTALPIGLIAAVLGVAVIAVLVARRIRFAK